ncbi:MAG: hypothetical protein FD179_1639 [Erysipelotrichaceae bacterium]|nr:MAG: hypothetical protein FD179_1639 [Erysipelotrichaceae bacterium]
MNNFSIFIVDDEEVKSKIVSKIHVNYGCVFTVLSVALRSLGSVYFTHSNSSRERGTNEKHNRILRRFIS